MSTMTSRTTGTTVVVVGAGIVGSAIAAELASRGVPTTLLDEGAGVAATASLRSFAWLNTASADNPGYHHLRTLGLQRHLQRAARGGVRASAYSFGGSLSWGLPGAGQPLQGTDRTAETVEATHRRLHDWGHRVQLLDPLEAARREPGIALSEGVAHVLAADDEGAVELAALLAELRREFLAAGGEVVVTGGPVRLHHDGPHVGRVSWGAAGIDPAQVVLAVGARTPELTTELGHPVPARSTPGLVVETTATSSPLSRIVRGPWSSVRPSGGGRLLLHSTTGDATVTPDTWTVPDDAVAELLEGSARQLRLDGPLEAASVRAGWRPVPGDGLPVVGRLGEGNVTIAFTHSGATLSLLLGELVASEVAEAAPVAELLRPYRPTRFTLQEGTS